MDNRQKSPPIGSDPKQAKITRLDWLLFALVVLVALGLRLYQLVDFPQGLVADAAINGLDAWRLGQRGGLSVQQGGLSVLLGGLPVFVPGNGGREALWLYLQAVSIALFGTTPLAVRLPGVVVDTATAGLMFWFARWYFAHLPQPDHSPVQGRWPALWAGLWLAGSHWLLVVSRLGFRAVLVPLVAVGLFWALLLGWRERGRWGWLILSGVCLGLAGYTYSAAKVLPVVVGLVLLPALFKLRRPWFAAEKRLWSGLLMLMVVAALVYAPMLHYTATHPAQANNRTMSVAVWAFTDSWAGLLKALGENLVSTAAFFCCQGNAELILFGLPSRPAQGVVLGGLLLLGVWVAWRQSEKLAYRLLPVWFFLAWLPTLLAIEAPHALRLIGAAPPAALLVALGMQTVTQKWDRFRPQKRPWLAVAFTLSLLGMGWFSFRDYYHRWPAAVDVPGLFGYRWLEQAAAAERAVGQGQVVYMPQALYARPQVRYYLSGPFPPDPVAHFIEPAPQAVFLDLAGKPLSPAVALAEEPAAWVRLSPGQAAIMPSPAPAQPEPLPVPAQLGPARLSAAAYPAVLPAEGDLGVTLFWQATEPIEADYEILLHLVDDARQGYSQEQVSAPAYPTSLWRPDRDIVPDFHQLRLADELPVGRYWLAVAVFDGVSGERLPLRAGDDLTVVSPDTVFVGPLKRSPPPAQIELGREPLGQFVGVAVLAGLNLPQTALPAGQPLQVELVWRATAAVEIDYTVFVHLLDIDNNRLTGYDSQPWQGRYPTGVWTAGELIPDRYQLDTTGLPPGPYRLAVGLYDPSSGVRVAAVGRDEGQLVLGPEYEIRVMSDE